MAVQRAASELVRRRRLHDEVLSWYDASARDLPWRRSRDPWAVLCSELMLQQTQAERVARRYEDFLASFPTPAEMATAPLARVLEAWRGLGYNRRAVNLHRTAVIVVTQHGGALPTDLEALRALPGVGPYTARAVAVFAHDAPVAPVDTNVRRVLARAVAGHPLGPAAAQRMADAVVPARRPAAWSHALMDIGACWCTARSPACAQCPVAAVCRWHVSGRPEPDPGASRSRPGPRPPFVGSDRFHRGRLVDALRDGPVRGPELGAAAQLTEDPARLDRLVSGLVDDGMVEADGEGGLRLPDARPGSPESAAGWSVSWGSGGVAPGGSGRTRHGERT